MAVTVPAWLPEKLCWKLSEEYHAPIAVEDTSASTKKAKCDRS